MATQRNRTAVLFSPIMLTSSTTHLILYTLFFFSGCAALLYQVMWQRMLFTVFGVDLVSITIVVSAFMFGLGMGGLFGGRLADRLPTRLLALYVAIELYIAIFGFLSPTWIDFLGDGLFVNSEWITAMVSFLILAVPTLLMGATFPILVAHVHRYTHNIGESVGGLYFANTLGGAAGAYFAGFILLYSMDVVGVIHCAVILNVLIAIVAFLFFRRKL